MSRTEILTVTILICILSFTSSCRKVVIDSEEKDIFLNRQHIGIYTGGAALFIYNETKHQMCTNSSRGVFRIQTISQDTCLNISLKENPSRKGDLIMAEIDYSDPTDRMEDLIQFECSGMSGNKLWLWNGHSKTGIIILKP
ncbi:MAG: hypothetical protein KBS57_05230 [Alistipes sp.]|nr:hypothetical protein [Candidatus Minthomonas equi]